MKPGKKCPCRCAIAVSASLFLLNLKNIINSHIEPFKSYRFYSPYKGNALVLASLIPQQLLGEQISILREQPPKLFLWHTLQPTESSKWAQEISVVTCFFSFLTQPTTSTTTHLRNVSNVKICVLDICRVGSAVRNLDPLVGHLYTQRRSLAFIKNGGNWWYGPIPSE